MFSNNLASDVPNNIPRNLRPYSFISFSIVWVIHFINKPESLRDLTIFMISSTSLINIISVVVHEPELPDYKIFL